MNHASLTTRYRPQTFGQAAGQEIIKTILSKAALENRIAAAYLFSGTRGVGKTTLARVFAKALNCVNAPTAEPCNECESCRKITAGMAVDVLEMDGASNRGIEDAKRLREVVNYAPMEGRYKIFIIDEAHMLSRDAFNALLKTIEEPPPRVTFILATTEPHKFPATIVSRCQHFVFKRLNNHELEAHLTYILNAEGAAFDPEAVSLIAKRAAGSVRDAMSLLGQVLALGGEKLSVASVRHTLGLAGEDLFLSLLRAVQHKDSLAALKLARVILDQGVDMGFFLRELSAMWRNLFMLRQAGVDAAKVLDMTPTEAETWLAATNELALTHIHACWQLTLEGQRRVLAALEPAQALELLLLNLTVLPTLIPVQALPGAALPDIAAAPPAEKKSPTITSAAPESPLAQVPADSGPVRDLLEKTPPSAPPSAPQNAPPSVLKKDDPAAAGGNTAPDEASATDMTDAANAASLAAPEPAPVADADVSAMAEPAPAPAKNVSSPQPASPETAPAPETAPVPETTSAPASAPEAPPAPDPAPAPDVAPNTSATPTAPPAPQPVAPKKPTTPTPAASPKNFSAAPPDWDDVPLPTPHPGDLADDDFDVPFGPAARANSAPAPAAPTPPSGAPKPAATAPELLRPQAPPGAGQEQALTEESAVELDWEAFVRFWQAKFDPDPLDSALGIVDGVLGAKVTQIICSSQLSLDRLAASEALPKLKTALAAFSGRADIAVDLILSDQRHKTKKELREEALQHPKVRLLQTQLNAGLIDCRDTRN